MKRLLLPLSLVALVVLVVLVVLGFGAYFQTARPWHSFPGGKMRWDPLTRTTTIHVHSKNAVINATELDLSRTRIVRAHPDGAILIRITGGNPSVLKDLVHPDLGPVHIINPAGVIVGNDRVVDHSGSAVFSTLDDGRAKASDFDPPVAFSPGTGIFDEFGRGARSNEVLLMPESRTQEGRVVELKAHGNVYALAIKSEGGLRATGRPSRDGDGIPPRVEPVVPVQREE